MIEICTREIRDGHYIMKPGDRFMKRKLNERTLNSLRRQRQVVPLTRETYANLMARYQPGHVGAGFTVPELIALDILDKPEGDLVEKAAPKPESAPKTALAVTHGEKIPFGEHFIRPRKRGHFTDFEVLNADGDLLRASAFKKIEKAEEFLTALSTAAAA